MWFSIASIALVETYILAVAVNARRKSPWTCHSCKARGRWS